MRLIADGRVIYPFFGITYQTINWQNAAQASLPVDNGVYITEVTAGGPAQLAGLQPADIVIAINGVSIDQQNAFAEVLFAHEPGETISVDVVRGGQQMTVELTLVERPANT
ncbi:MAG: PDZ domain-containing protein [Thermomicrobiales bacterium]|nr:PDZ domain-containing protein [Thermomicrobiales bacterium]